MSEKILLTGSTGFIGSHLRERLKKSYDLSTFERRDGYDMTDEDQVRSAVAGKSMVLHFAAAAVGRQKMKKNPEAKKSDLKGLKNIAHAALDEKSFLIYPSSTLADGDSQYGALKKESEEHLLALEEKGLHCTILRLATVYGPGVPEDSLIRLFLERALRGEPLNIFGPGSEKRNFIHIDDVCSAVEDVLKKSSEAEGKTFNLCSNESTTLNELADLILEITHSHSQVIHTIDPPPPDQIVNNEGMKKTFNWESKISLRQGISTLLDKIGLLN